MVRFILCLLMKPLFLKYLYRSVFLSYSNRQHPFDINSCGFLHSTTAWPQPPWWFFSRLRIHMLLKMIYSSCLPEDVLHISLVNCLSDSHSHASKFISIDTSGLAQKWRFICQPACFTDFCHCLWVQFLSVFLGMLIESLSKYIWVKVCFHLNQCPHHCHDLLGQTT